MKYILGISLIIISIITWASTDSFVLISGTIGNSYNENEVKITDSLEQTMFIPSRLFPKDFKFTQGTSFSIEIPEAELNNIKKIKSVKK